MNRDTPSAIPQETALLGACLLDPHCIDTALTQLDTTDFHHPRHRLIWQAITKVHNSGHQVDVLTVHQTDPTIPLDYLHQLQNGIYSTSNVTAYTTPIIDTRIRRDLIHRAAQITEAAYTATDAEDAIDTARWLTTTIDRPETDPGAPDPTIDEYIDNTDTTYDWLIPGFLERRDRCLVTAAEGAGKSVLLTQIAVQAAAGIHPWSLAPITPINVLIVDCENSAKLVARRLRLLRQHTRHVDNLRVASRPEGIDLLTRTDLRWLTDRCRANNTDLLIIGPAYRLSAGVANKSDIGGEDHAKRVTAAIDEIRTRGNLAIIMETHAPHGGMAGRDLRPFGSSVWLRWPEFGIGLRPDGDTHDRYRLEHWRGPRDQREWPSALIKNAGQWPWTAELPPPSRWAA